MDTSRATIRPVLSIDDINILLYCLHRAPQMEDIRTEMRRAKLISNFAKQLAIHGVYTQHGVKVGSMLPVFTSTAPPEVYSSIGGKVGALAQQTTALFNQYNEKKISWADLNEEQKLSLVEQVAMGIPETNWEPEFKSYFDSYCMKKLFSTPAERAEQIADGMEALRGNTEDFL